MKSPARKFNIVDIIIIIVIVFAAVGTVKFLNGRSEEAKAGGSQTVRFAFEGRNVLLGGASLVKKGDKIYNSNNSEYIGVVTGVDIVPYKLVEFNPETAAYEEMEVPDRYDVTVYAEGTGYHNDANVVVEGQIIKVGQQFNLKGKGYAFEGYIVKVEV